ncbi:MAG: hypothetical protein A2Z20_00710 [Bdellovibrionales bacterium RBG_16_40_8]|nr:MAG: hypothetical protein A2Z20_00710 [Bdellovibrionales bacterium RBG_16_40_8]
MKVYSRPFVAHLSKTLKKQPEFIHVVLGPRQVGKTMGVLQLIENNFKKEAVYASADGDMPRTSAWFLEKWLQAKSKSPAGVLVIDEVQKIENWSESVKKLWDEQKIQNNGQKLKLVLLGSSSLNIQKGLSESLTGRYMLHKVMHWDYFESAASFGLSLDDYLSYGGYPASYSFIKNRVDWIHYIENSIIQPVLGKDILSLARVKSPALFRQCFDLACAYAAQEISYTKLLGQLQEKGNVELVKHYLELFEGAFLIKQLHKFSNKKVLSRSSSPKILPLCPALFSITLDADLSSTESGRAFELMIGAMLCQLPGTLYYWREKNVEVDYVLKFGKKIWAIEVKSSEKPPRGLEKFKENYPTCEQVLITRDNFQNVIAELRRHLA